MARTIRSFYDTLTPSPGFESKYPSVTQQHFKDEADINYIIKMYDSSGVYPGVTGAAPREPMFGDFSDLPANAQQVYNQLIEARNNFDQMPLEIRKRFNYDPSAFLDFVQDPANVKELVSMGLASERVDDDVSKQKIQSGLSDKDTVKTNDNS